MSKNSALGDSLRSSTPYQKNRIEWVIIEWLERVTHRKFTNRFTNREFNTSKSLDTLKIHQSQKTITIKSKSTLQLLSEYGKT
jgi:hypothetical protein